VKEVTQSKEHGYGNDAPAEITERFPQQLGNLAKNARFPHSHKPIIRCSFIQSRQGWGIFDDQAWGVLIDR
jgi:hypothetical protein